MFRQPVLLWLLATGSALLLGGWISLEAISPLGLKAEFDLLTQMEIRAEIAEKK